MSDILRELGELSEPPAERWLRRLPTLEVAGQSALLGGFPFVDMAYTPIDIDAKRAVTAVPTGRPASVPADSRQRQQDLKHRLKESPAGLAQQKVLPSFTTMICKSSDVGVLPEMNTDAIRASSANVELG